MPNPPSNTRKLIKAHILISFEVCGKNPHKRQVTFVTVGKVDGETLMCLSVGSGKKKEGKEDNVPF